MDLDVELPHATLLCQPRSSAWLVMVVCKVTFSIQPHELVLARAQQPVTLEDSFWDGDPSRSLSAASDLVPSKPRADVLVVGSAFAPAGTLVASLTARVRFESIDKSIDIVADRGVAADGTLYRGQSFSRMPLVYERAAGGPGTWNPVGIPAGARNAHGHAPLPNITRVGEAGITTSMPEPIGLGPIAASWPGRISKLGADAGIFARGGWQHRPLPERLDLAYFNAAPPDQQVDAIPEDAPLALDHLSAQHALLKTRLPGIRPRVVVERGSGQERPSMHADTLLIDTDRAVVVVTWRGHFPVDHQQERYRVRTGCERPSQSWGAARSGARRTGTIVDPEEARADGPTAAPFDRSVARTSGPGRATGAVLPFQNDARPSERRGSHAALPFAPARALPAVSPPPLSRSALVPQQTQTLEVPAGWAPVAPVVVNEPPAAIKHDPAAGFGGVVSASNAAADPEPSDGHAQLTPGRFDGDVLQLLWFLPAAARLMRRRTEWKKLVDELAPAAFDPDVDDASDLADPADLQDHREIYAVIAGGAPCDHESIERVLRGEARGDGRFVPQLLLLRGEARFEFDEVELLKATLSAAAAFTADDEALRRSVEEAASFLAAPGLVASAAVTNAVTARIQDTFRGVVRAVPASYLEDQTERALLERRAYQKRAVFGEPHLRSLFFIGRSTIGVPAYFPVQLAQTLPLLRRVRLRALCEAHFQADQHESHPAALRGAAVARIVR